MTHVSLAWVASTTAFEAPSVSNLFRTLQSSLVKTLRAASMTKLVDAEGLLLRSRVIALRSSEVSEDSEPFLDRDRGSVSVVVVSHQRVDAQRDLRRSLNADQAACGK